MNIFYLAFRKAQLEALPDKIGKSNYEMRKQPQPCILSFRFRLPFVIRHSCLVIYHSPVSPSLIT
ncbi:MAG: hypothetical protein DMF42_09985 [Verrucomicrobia bacterium]|nr:MAG: hypothetical protein DME74_11490 [Verrucomicrobiota bacterium]PYL41608.1 MAG: hypothetical protein DMF42_09985 [Verrucomicrobiota bacterium]